MPRRFSSKGVMSGAPSMAAPEANIARLCSAANSAKCLSSARVNSARRSSMPSVSVCSACETT